MKAEELRTLEQEDLTIKLKDTRRELYELRFKMAVGQLEDNQQIRRVRKEIARILTVIHQREHGALVAVAPVVAPPADDRTPVAAAAVVTAEADAKAETTPAAAEEEEQS